MGYRSDVAAVFYTQDETKVGVIKMWLRENLPFKDWGEEAFDERSDGYDFYVRQTKWYDAYSEVERMDELMEKFRALFCDVDDPDGALEFVRIGEEDADIEIERYGNYDFRVSVGKSICIE